MKTIHETNGSNTWIYNNEQKYKKGKLPCESCGKPVTVMLPFVGCVYCSDCITASNNYYSSGSKDRQNRGVEGTNNK